MLLELSFLRCSVELKEASWSWRRAEPQEYIVFLMSARQGGVLWEPSIMVIRGLLAEVS